ncbi:hypothetical protein [Devosia sediminis]|uniref:Uncharacterized protein n=1 Tax=Devosia sediminis TaxID=2798801 RepID=A0A934IVC0_9HYPH|nr:hypothetical protein [Devosia sediminis]MBJ3783448.1 hypothetical protein [Devosia sediminis]
MTANALNPRPNADAEAVLALLASAEAHIRADRLDEASAQYRLLLEESALDQLPAARIEVFANYGALLLHEARLTEDEAELRRTLDQAIDMLTRARAGRRRDEFNRNSVISDTNLALAYFQRHVATGNHADLMSAHLALDGAEAVIPADDRDLHDWVRSIRDLLVDQADRRRNPR